MWPTSKPRPCDLSSECSIFRLDIDITPAPGNGTGTGGSEECVMVSACEVGLYNTSWLEASRIGSHGDLDDNALIGVVVGVGEASRLIFGICCLGISDEVLIPRGDDNAGLGEE